MSTKTIFRYELHIDDHAEIRMPVGAQILSVGIKPGDTAISVWALVAPVSPDETRRFRIIGTGHKIIVGTKRFLGTVQMHNGALVFHVFEEETMGVTP